MDRPKADIKRVSSRLQLRIPYHPDWPDKARAIGGRWRYRSKVWSFPADRLLEVLDALIWVYGQGVLSEYWEHQRAELKGAIRGHA